MTLEVLPRSTPQGLPWPGCIRIRRALKILLRGFGLRCVALLDSLLFLQVEDGMIVPTLGCIVWFTPATGEHTATDNGMCAAMVVKVLSPRMVNLIVFDANGLAQPRADVPLLQDDDPVPAAGHFCQWMPYQVEAAKRQQTAAAAK